MGKRKTAKQKQQPPQRRPNAQAGQLQGSGVPSPLPTLFQVALRLPLDYGLVPLASLLTLCAHALHWATRAIFVGLLWGSLLLVVNLLILRPLHLARWAGQVLTQGFVALLSGLLLPIAPADTRALRSSLARLEKRLKRTEQNLKQQHQTLQRLLQQQQQSPVYQERLAHQVPEAVLAQAPSRATPPPAAAPLPPPPPPPTMARPPLALKLKSSSTSATGKARSSVPTPAVTLQDLMRVKLKPASKRSGDADRSDCSSANTSLLNGSFGAPSQRKGKGLSVSLADITNVQLRRATAHQPAHGAGARGSPLKVPAGFKLKRVQGILRSPGGTPIRPDIVRSSPTTVVDNFANALKKKFESSLISSPPRSPLASPAGSPMPRTPISLNASFACSPKGLAACLSPSASFFDCSILDSSILSPIPSDKL